MTIAFSTDNDIIVPSVQGETYRGGGGDDIYMLFNEASSGDAIVIDDTEGVNTIQLLDGLSIESSIVMQNAAQLTLSNGAVLQIIGASNYTYDAGGNKLLGTTGSETGYNDFVTQVLGTTVPTQPGGVSYGGAVVIGEASGTDINLEANNIYTAVDGVSEHFIYDIDTTSGRAVQSDGEVEILNFNVDEDTLVFNDVQGGTATTANFEAFPGVSISENPFQIETSIYFDSSIDNTPGGITLQGILDADMNTISYEVV